jgi:hypothetical protein
MAIYENISVELTGEDGNAFAIMAKITRALRKGGASNTDIEKYQAESMSGSYDNLLQTAMKWVNVV